MNEIEFLENMGKLDLEDGDIVVLKSKRVLSEDDYMRMKGIVMDCLKTTGKKVKVLVLEETEIGIIRGKATLQ